MALSVRTIFKFITGGNIENAFHEEIYRLTSYDPELQIWNKHHFLEELERETARSQRYQKPLSVLLASLESEHDDVDVAIHDGTAELRRLMPRLKKRLPESSILARFADQEISVRSPTARRRMAALEGSFSTIDVPSPAWSM